MGTICTGGLCSKLMLCWGRSASGTRLAHRHSFLVILLPMCPQDARLTCLLAAWHVLRRQRPRPGGRHSSVGNLVHLPRSVTLQAHVFFKASIYGVLRGSNASLIVSGVGK